MNGKLLIVGIVCLAALPSCMHPVDQVLNANAEAKRQALLASGSVSQGACDDVGQYSSRNNDAAQRLTLASNAEPTAAYLAVR